MKTKVERVLSRISSERIFTTIQEIAGTKNDKKIRDYIAKRLHHYGLKVCIQEFPILSFDSGQARFFVKGYQEETPAVPLIRSISTASGGVNGPLKYAGAGREKDFGGDDWTGSLVLVDPPNLDGVHQRVNLKMPFEIMQ